MATFFLARDLKHALGLGLRRRQFAEI
jgi:hypothetical protein